MEEGEAAREDFEEAGSARLRLLGPSLAVFGHGGGGPASRAACITLRALGGLWKQTLTFTKLVWAGAGAMLI